jgi:hypothetical protein
MVADVSLGILPQWCQVRLKIPHCAGRKFPSPQQVVFTKSAGGCNMVGAGVPEKVAMAISGQRRVRFFTATT